MPCPKYDMATQQCMMLETETPRIGCIGPRSGAGSPPTVWRRLGSVTERPETESIEGSEDLRRLSNSSRKAA